MGRSRLAWARCRPSGVVLRCLARFVGFFLVAGLGAAWGSREINAIVLAPFVGPCWCALHIALATMCVLSWPTIKDARSVFMLRRYCSWHALLSAGGLAVLALAYIAASALVVAKWVSSS